MWIFCGFTSCAVCSHLHFVLDISRRPANAIFCCFYNAYTPNRTCQNVLSQYKIKNMSRTSFRPQRWREIYNFLRAKQEYKNKWYDSFIMCTHAYTHRPLYNYTDCCVLEKSLSWNWRKLNCISLPLLLSNINGLFIFIVWTRARWRTQHTVVCSVWPFVCTCRFVWCRCLLHCDIHTYTISHFATDPDIPIYMLAWHLDSLHCSNSNDCYYCSLILLFLLLLLLLLLAHSLAPPPPQARAALSPTPFGVAHG